MEKNDKIRRTKICQSYQNDGIKMIDVDIFVASLKCSWIKRLQDNSATERKWVTESRISLNEHTGCPEIDCTLFICSFSPVLSPNPLGQAETPLSGSQGCQLIR